MVALYGRMCPMTDYVSLVIGPKSRLVLPLALRRAAGVDVGSELVGHVDESGRIVFESAASARARVWAGAPAAGREATALVRAARDDDVAVEAARESRRAARADGDGTDLLGALGL